jgi:DNA-binding transcriptional LysR family regulator
MPFLARLKALVPRLDVEWVELTIVDQFQAVADGRVDAAVCRLPLGHDELVAGSELFLDRRKLVVPSTHRLADAGTVDPEELADEVLPVVPADQQLSPWTAFHFPRLTPKGHPIGRGPVVRTVRECMAAVETGSAVVIMGARSEPYYSHPGVRYLNIDLPPAPTALVWRRSETRQAILSLEECARGVASERITDVGAAAVAG